MRSNSEAKILVVESGPALRGEIAGRLGATGFNVVVADHGAAVRRLIEVFEPDVAVIEILDDRPEEIVQTIRSLSSARVIVTMVASAPPDRRVRAIRAGADDVVIKPFDVDELLVRIDAVLRLHGTNEVLSFGDLTIDEIGHLVFRGQSELELTVTEFNLLAMLVRNAGRVISKRQLLATVWGFDDYDVNLVEVHVSALRKKLEMHGPRIVQTVRGIGYVLRALGAECRSNPAGVLLRAS